MYKLKVPILCQPCIDRLQAHCLHQHTNTYGGFHFSGGEVWDDITEVCDDCGANLDLLPIQHPSLLTHEEIPF